MEVLCSTLPIGGGVLPSTYADVCYVDDVTSQSSGLPKGTNKTDLWLQVYETIRTVSPSTLISSKRGDVCRVEYGRTLYTADGPAPNSTTDIAPCGTQHEGAPYFHPIETHGITIQEGQ